MTNDKPPAIICLFGITGSGKSSFINDASGDTLAVGHGQMSCTNKVVQARKFILDGREICLVDTPGFDDTLRTDSEILGLIGDFLVENYGRREYLTAMIYLHRITDNRFGGVSKRNFRVLRELCGPNALENLVICTNFWTYPPSKIHEVRENELRTSSLCFQPAIAKGARLYRLTDRGEKGAQAIIRHCLERGARPVQFQLETTRGLRLRETSAGRILCENLEGLLREKMKGFSETSRKLEDARRKNDEEAREELEEAQKENAERIQKLMGNIDLLEARIGAERRQNEEERIRQHRLWEQQQAECLNWAHKYETLQAQICQLNENQGSSRLKQESDSFLGKIGGMCNVLGTVVGILSSLGVLPLTMLM